MHRVMRVYVCERGLASLGRLLLNGGSLVISRAYLCQDSHLKKGSNVPVVADGLEHALCRWTGTKVWRLSGKKKNISIASR